MHARLGGFTFRVALLHFLQNHGVPVLLPLVARHVVLAGPTAETKLFNQIQTVHVNDAESGGELEKINDAEADAYYAPIRTKR